MDRFAGITRPYTQQDVQRLKGTFEIEHTVSKKRAEKLWRLLNEELYVNTLGSLSGNHAVQHAKAGLKAIYLSGWQVAADANSAGEMYPDQSLYPYDSVPRLIKAMNNALARADQIQQMELLDGKLDPKDVRDYAMPHSGRWRGGIWRALERVRTYQEDDRGGGSGHPSGGSIGGGKEMRAHGRQGTDPNAECHKEFNSG